MSNMSVDPQAKKEIMNSLSIFEKVAKKVAKNVAQTAGTDTQLMNALQTRNITNSMITEQNAPIAAVQTGGYAVFAMPNESGKTRFDVVNMHTQSKIVGGLHLAEAANSIVKLLNTGHSFYSPQIKNILDFENSYVKHYQDAVTFKRKSNASSAKDAIMETRFEESKLKAVEAKQKLLEYTKKI